MPAPTAITAHITGRVQGVAFRAFARDAAQARGLAGWVRNEADGSVTALIEGDGAAVDDMISVLRRGPVHARVKEVATALATPEGRDGFEIRR